MRDIPIFTTEYGVASLILKEIPYKKIAYIRLRTIVPGFQKELLEECAVFCRMAGAERIFAAAEEPLDLPLAVSVWKMQGQCCPDAELTASLFPVTEETAAQWRRLYNEAMAPVDNAATLESRDETRIARSSGTYFVHDAGKLLGIGWVEDNQLLAIASVEKGQGKRILHTLMTLLQGQTMTLEVASTNIKAICLYEGMGFLKTGEVSRWYQL